MSKKGLCKEIAEVYDALVLIHPDFAEPFNPDYEQNLCDIIEAFGLSGKPVFAAEPIGTEKMRQYLRNAVIIPYHPSKHNVEERSQKGVDFIAGYIGRLPKDIKLAFGGIYAHACVYFYATSWCETVETKRPNEYLRSKTSANPIKYGKILEEIT